MPAPSPEAIQYQLQHFNDDESNRIIASFGVCLALAIIAVLLRFLARHLNRASLGADDWTIVVGLVGPLKCSPDPRCIAGKGSG